MLKENTNISAIQDIINQSNLNDVKKEKALNLLKEYEAEKEKEINSLKEIQNEKQKLTFLKRIARTGAWLILKKLFEMIYLE